MESIKQCHTWRYKTNLPNGTKKFEPMIKKKQVCFMIPKKGVELPRLTDSVKIRGVLWDFFLIPYIFINKYDEM